ncbi:MAG: helix-turn-helix domain-containing protein [Parasphingopyxis sp.]|uniref:helix-turn-helix domain-containing protein n=1 Tax=Parasphingopyxis sp. TaxID=1920299 RepID=UPI003FA030C4
MTKSVFSDAYRTLLELLVESRDRANLHQTELADRVGWDQTKISNVERGIRRIDVIEFCALAKAMNLDPVELFAELNRRLPSKLEI